MELPGKKKPPDVLNEFFLDGLIGLSLAISDNGQRMVANYQTSSSQTQKRGVYTYQWTNEGWEKSNDSLEVQSPSELYAYNLALSGDGNTLIAASLSTLFWNENQKGKVYVYQRDNDQWVPKGTPILDDQTFSFFGGNPSVSFDGNVIAFSASRHDVNGVENAGSVFCYEWDGQNWVLRGESFKGSQINGNYGGSIDLSATGNQLAIGNTTGSNAEFSGLIEVYQWNGSEWASMGSPIEAAYFMGQQVKISGNGNRVLGGATSFHYNYDSRVVAYDWNGQNWEPIGEITAPQVYKSCWACSLTLSADGTRCGIGDLNASINAGEITFFEFPTVNTKEIAASKALIAFPNPTSDFIYFQGNNHPIEFIRIYNYKGELVEQVGTIESNFIDVSKLITGWYSMAILQKGEWQIISFIKR